jgi:hypothetical protein
MDIEMVDKRESSMVWQTAEQKEKKMVVMLVALTVLRLVVKKVEEKVGK